MEKKTLHKFPLNIQYFAGEAGGEGDGAGNGAGAESLDDLKAQLAAEKAEAQRLKASLDKTLKEKGDITKQLRAKQTTEEQEAEARRLAEEERTRETENLRAEINKMKAERAYTPVLADSKTIENIISAVDEKDHNSIALIIDTAIKAAIKEAQNEWNRTNPPISAGGTYSEMSLEEIMKIQDRDERQKALARRIANS